MGITQTQPGLEQVQSELAARIGLMNARALQQPLAELAIEIDAIRRIAFRNGLFPAVTVTQALESALARGERGALIFGWLAILGDAVGSDRQDRAACETYAAACSVRLCS